MQLRLPVALALLGLLISPTTSRAAQVGAPSGLSLSVSPGVIDVGGQATFTLRARKWNGPNSVTLSFLSPHHGFTGAMPWRPSCGCFQLVVVLARRIHPLETARAAVTVKTGKALNRTISMFQIRGLTNNGHDFAPGGKVLLNAWVSDPHPSKNEYQHYCTYTHTIDGLGVSGYRVHFVAHFPGGNRTYGAGTTNRDGIACTSKSVGNVASGTVVSVRAYAGNLQTNVRFSTQS